MEEDTHIARTTGRHVLVIDPEKQKGGATFTNTFWAILRGLRRMATEYPYWDVSWLVAVFFTVGCLVFIASGLFSWLPLVSKKYKFHGETTAADVTAFVGATLFQIGAVLLVFEACNEQQTGCFGWALYEAFHHHGESSSSDIEAIHPGDPGEKIMLAHAAPHWCKHHHQRGRRGEPLLRPAPGRRWSWWPSWHELRTHYIHEIGFVASAAMSIGATIFYICGICSLPGIYSNMSLGVARGIYWLTYLVGGILFIISSALYLLETQPNWYTPAPHLLGWHIGVWNMIGSVGWTLAASFGYCTASWCAYQSELTLTWASAAFTIGSALLWYEALDKYSVEQAGNKC